MKKQLYIETNDMKDLNIYRNIRVKLRIWLIRFEGNGYLLCMICVYAKHINIHIDVREFHIAKHVC